MNKRVNLKKIIICILMIYVLYIFASQQITITRIKAERNQKISELNEAKKKNRELQDQVQMSKSDSYIEKIAREKLNFVKKGETPVINNSQKKDLNNSK